MLYKESSQACQPVTRSSLQEQGWIVWNQYSGKFLDDLGIDLFVNVLLIYRLVIWFLIWLVCMADCFVTDVLVLHVSSSVVGSLGWYPILP